MNNQHVCPVESAGGLDNSLRRFFQNPGKILEPFISKEMTVLDLGCGPGFFTIEIARMLSGPGKVIAADLQDGMLEKVKSKIQGTELEQRIVLHKCLTNTIGAVKNVDFILAFYMIHEVPDHDRLFNELRSILKPDGKLYIIEPKFHVTKKAFAEMMNKVRSNGFEIIAQPKVFFSRAVLLSINK
jgi:ubiquinone/menaquinone biosynthesis C-methylase UbiE